MPIPLASTSRSPRRSTNRPATGAEAKRTSANTEMTAPAAKLLTPKSLANRGIAGASIPNPSATENATAVSTATSGGNDPNGLRADPAGRVTGASRRHFHLCCQDLSARSRRWSSVVRTWISRVRSVFVFSSSSCSTKSWSAFACWNAA